MDGLTAYRHPESTADPMDALVVGYGTPPGHVWAGPLDALCASLPQ